MPHRKKSITDGYTTTRNYLILSDFLSRLPFSEKTREVTSMNSFKKDDTQLMSWTKQYYKPYECIMSHSFSPHLEWWKLNLFHYFSILISRVYRIDDDVWLGFGCVPSSKRRFHNWQLCPLARKKAKKFYKLPHSDHSFVLRYQKIIPWKEN